MSDLEVFGGYAKDQTMLRDFFAVHASDTDLLPYTQTPHNYPRAVARFLFADAMLHARAVPCPTEAAARAQLPPCGY